MPAARPSSFTTYGAPNSSSAAATSSTVSQVRDRAVGTPAEAITCFAKSLDPSSRAAARDGPKQAIPLARMASARVPTARSRTCVTAGEVAAALDEFGAPFVVKDDGLAVPLVPAQDFKRIGDGDTGPNTGGMGAYAPLPWASPSLVDDVMSTVVGPTLAEMRRLGTPFAGLLYVGLVLTADGPKVIEFNCRFGDPETQVVLPLLETPLAGLLHAAAVGELGAAAPLRWRPGFAVTVVVASEGYPGTARVGVPIEGADVPGVLHAGTAWAGGTLVSAGGRVLNCTATGTTLVEAREAAYALVDGVCMDGAQYRRDIAERALRPG